jgi:glc operon protein GlcG
MAMRKFVLLVLASFGQANHAAAADTAMQSNLTLEGAQRVAAAAIAYARSHSAPGGAIAIVDGGGHIVLVQRLDGTFAAGADVSVGKARTTVMFRRPTRQIEETINKGRAAMTPVAAVTWFTPLQGGIPLMVSGQLVGGIGVSGAASAQQDEEIALAGAQALLTPPPQATVIHVPAQRVLAAYSHGETGDTLVNDAAYRVNASRRDGPGQAEIHVSDTDVFYVLEGRANVVTGGELLEPRQIAPNEIRGLGIRGGEQRDLGPGDILTIPRGVPHWFREVKTPFRYYVIKSVNGA